MYFVLFAFKYRHVMFNESLKFTDVIETSVLSLAPMTDVKGLQQAAIASNQIGKTIPERSS